MSEFTKGEWKLPNPMTITTKQGLTIARTFKVDSLSGQHIEQAEAEANAKLIAAAPKLLDACEAWMLVESEMGDKHPCPDVALRAQYRKNAVKLTIAAIASVNQ